MLLELRVENLLLIERAELRLAPGLNVLTGETGAGKTVLAHALDLLLGGRARSGIVRPGAAEAYVEGVFDLPAGRAQQLAERLPDDAEELVLARRVSAEGRTRAYLERPLDRGGRPARAVSEGLLSFYGQHEHRRLTLASAQLDVLDGFCGAEQTRRRAEHAEAWARARELRTAREELAARAGARERELDLLEFELAEIEEAAPERGRGGRAGEPSASACAISRGCAPRLWPAPRRWPRRRAGPGAGVPAGRGRRSSSTPCAGVDPRLDGLAERLRASRLELEDLGGELRRYEQEVEGEPGRLEEVEDRLGRPGAPQAQARRNDRRRARARRELPRAARRARRRRGRAGALGGRAGGGRGGAGQAGRWAAARPAAPPPRGWPRRSGSVSTELAMEGAPFDVELEERDEPGPAGADVVEFRIAPNPGVPAGPLREIASGGELSRVMLALMGVAARGQRRERRAAAAARDAPPARLRRGRRGHRRAHRARRGRTAARPSRTAAVLCITHLPQVASMAARHFRIEKDLSSESGPDGRGGARRRRGRGRARPDARRRRRRRGCAQAREVAAEGGVDARGSARPTVTSGVPGPYTARRGRFRDETRSRGGSGR